LLCAVDVHPWLLKNSKSSISRENFLFFEKFSLISANVEPEAALELRRGGSHINLQSLLLLPESAARLEPPSLSLIDAAM